MQTWLYVLAGEHREALSTPTRMETLALFSQAGTVHDVGVVGFFTACNLTLTFMQWYWGYLIVRAATKMLSGGKKDSKIKKQ